MEKITRRVRAGTMPPEDMLPIDMMDDDSPMDWEWIDTIITVAVVAVIFASGVWVGRWIA